MTSSADLPLGPVMLDVAGTELADDDRQRLIHPQVGAVILFTRNFNNKKQITKLIKEIRELRSPSLLVAVDQEGGRVQRFRDGFSALPPAAAYGASYDRDRRQGELAAYAGGLAMAAELVAVGVDFSFAPVLDVCTVDSEVIGERSFHADPNAVVELAGAFIDGMNAAGMAATGKHFPGHGGVAGDSHACLPRDERGIEEVSACDLLPFRALTADLSGVMSAHVHYAAIDDEIPTYSTYWLRRVLRRELGFDGVVFSDDLSMEGAKQEEIVECGRRALAAGCDMLLVCNDPEAADSLLQGLEADRQLSTTGQSLTAKLGRMRARLVAPTSLNEARRRLEAVSEN